MALPDLFVETLRNPKGAAQQIMAFNPPREVIGMGLALAVCLNTLAFSISIRNNPNLPELPAFFTNPFIFGMVLAVILLVTARAMFWVAGQMNGQGRFEHLLALVVWLQLLRAVAQAVLFVLTLISAGLATLFAFGVGVMGLWILSSFVAAAMHLPNAFQGLVVIILAGVAMLLGIVVVLGIAQMLGLVAPPNV